MFLRKGFARMKSRNTFVIRECWVGVLIIQIYKCLGITTSQFVYKKNVSCTSCNTRGRYDKRKNTVNTDNTPVPKQLVNLGRSQINLKWKFFMMLYFHQVWCIKTKISLMLYFFDGDIYCYREPDLLYKKIKFLMTSSPNRHCIVPNFLFVNSLWYNLYHRLWCKLWYPQFIKKFVAPEIFEKEKSIWFLDACRNQVFCIVYIYIYIYISRTRNF